MTLSVERNPRDGSGGKDSAARALVRTAIPLDEDEIQALRSALVRVFHRPLELDIEIRPEVLGGVWVRVGDTVVDGSLSGKLETLRHHLRSQCGSLLAAGAWTTSREPRP